MEKAAEARDADDFAEFISNGYKDPSGMSREEAVQTIRRYFAAYEHFEIVLTDIEVKHFEGAASATFRADMVGTPRAIGGLDAWLPRNSSWRFEVRFVPEDGTWKAHWATWERVNRQTAS